MANPNDPDVTYRLSTLKPESYPINYSYLEYLQGLMQSEGLYRDDMIALPRFPVTCSDCSLLVVPAGHFRAADACPNACGWHIAR